jgi:hypothetical protein
LVTANPLGKSVGHLDLSPPRDLCYLSGGEGGFPKKYVVALLVLLSLAGQASAGADCALPKPPLVGPLGQWARDASARMDPVVYEQQQRQKAARATYEAW